MAKHEVICAICNQKFNTNLIQAVRHGARRYSHATCEPDNTDFVPLGEEADPDRQAIIAYCEELFEQPNFPIISKQLKKYHDEQGMSYSGILKSLRYFYEIKHNSTDKANNAIGIVPFCYQDAYNYYLALFMAQQANEDKSLVTQTIEYIIPLPHNRGTKKRLLDWSLDDEE